MSGIGNCGCETRDGRTQSRRREVSTKQLQIAELAKPEGARWRGKVHSIYAANSSPEEPDALIGARRGLWGSQPATAALPGSSGEDLPISRFVKAAARCLTIFRFK